MGGMGGWPCSSASLGEFALGFWKGVRRSTEANPRASLLGSSLASDCFLVCKVTVL